MLSDCHASQVRQDTTQTSCGDLVSYHALAQQSNPLIQNSKPAVHFDAVNWKALNDSDLGSFIFMMWHP